MNNLCTRPSLVALFTFTGAIFAFLVDVMFTFNYVVGSDRWQDDVKTAFDVYNASWVVGSMVALAMLIGLCIQYYSPVLCVSMILSGAVNLAAAWFYIFTSNTHSDVHAPVRTWILTTAACICWMPAGVLSLWPDAEKEEVEVAGPRYSRLPSLHEEDDESGSCSEESR